MLLGDGYCKNAQYYYIAHDYAYLDLRFVHHVLGARTHCSLFCAVLMYVIFWQEIE